MRRKGAGRDLSDEDTDLLGRYMDDYFGPREDNPAAEDAYENSWMDCTNYWREKFAHLMDQVVGPHDA